MAPTGTPSFVVLVHDEQLTDGALDEPVGNRPRADPIVRHEPHERGSFQADERCDRRHLQNTGLGEERCRLHHL